MQLIGLSLFALVLAGCGGTGSPSNAQPGGKDGTPEPARPVVTIERTALTVDGSLQIERRLP